MCERSVKRVRGVVCVEVWLCCVNADDTTTTSPTYKSINCVHAPTYKSLNWQYDMSGYTRDQLEMPMIPQPQVRPTSR